MNTVKRKEEKMKVIINKKKLECALYLNFIAFALSIFRFDMKTTIGLSMLAITVTSFTCCMMMLDSLKEGLK